MVINFNVIPTPHIKQSSWSYFSVYCLWIQEVTANDECMHFTTKCFLTGVNYNHLYHGAV